MDSDHNVLVQQTTFESRDEVDAVLSTTTFSQLCIRAIKRYTVARVHLDCHALCLDTCSCKPLCLFFNLKIVLNDISHPSAHYQEMHLSILSMMIVNIIDMAHAMEKNLLLQNIKETIKRKKMLASSIS